MGAIFIKDIDYEFISKKDQPITVKPITRYREIEAHLM